MRIDNRKRSKYTYDDTKQLFMKARCERPFQHFWKGMSSLLTFLQNLLILMHNDNQSVEKWSNHGTIDHYYDVHQACWSYVIMSISMLRMVWQRRYFLSQWIIKVTFWLKSFTQSTKKDDGREAYLFNFQDWIIFKDKREGSKCFAIEYAIWEYFYEKRKC